MIHSDKCLELGLPIPASFDNQLTYVTKVISCGLKLNTRIARYIGIHNLHSLIPILSKRGLDFELEHGRVYCPFTQKTPPYPVDIIYMTTEQVDVFRKEKVTKK